MPPTGLLRLDGACGCGPPGCTLTPTRPPTLPSCLCASPFAALLPSVVCRHQPRPSRAPPHRHARTACRHQRLAGGAPPAALQRRRRRRGHRYLEAAERCLLAAHLSSRKPCTAAGCQAASPAPPYRRQSLSSCSSVFAQAPAHPAHPHRKLRFPAQRAGSLQRRHASGARVALRCPAVQHRLLIISTSLPTQTTSCPSTRPPVPSRTDTPTPLPETGTAPLGAAAAPCLLPEPPAYLPLLRAPCPSNTCPFCLLLAFACSAPPVGRALVSVAARPAARARPPPHPHHHTPTHHHQFIGPFAGRPLSFARARQAAQWWLACCLRVRPSTPPTPILTPPPPPAGPTPTQRTALSPPCPCHLHTCHLPPAPTCTPATCPTTSRTAHAPALHPTTAAASSPHTETNASTECVLRPPFFFAPATHHRSDSP